MKKTLTIFITILALVSFGTVSSAHAFVEPMATITLIYGATVMAIAALYDYFSNKPTEIEHVQEETEKAEETQLDTGLAVGQS